MISPEVTIPSPEITWAETKYDPRTGDTISRKIGIVRIGIGKKVYDLQEDPTLSARISTREVDAEENYSRIFLGFLGEASPTIRIVGLADKPFSLEDPSRINAASELARKLSSVALAHESSRQIEKEGMIYLNSLTSMVLEVDPSSLESIAILSEKLKQSLTQDYPSEYAEMADKMEKLGIAEIEIANLRPGTGHGRSNFTPEYVREVLGKKLPVKK